jgi:hypothetical protein
MAAEGYLRKEEGVRSHDDQAMVAQGGARGRRLHRHHCVRGAWVQSADSGPGA